MELRSLFVIFSLWQLTYLLVSRLLSVFLSHRIGESLVPEKDARFTLKHQAPAYIVSTLHAFIVLSRGIQHLVRLVHAPLLIKLQRPPPLLAATLPASATPFIIETDRVLFTNVILASYLLCDLVHVVRSYPSIGGMDTVLHHAAFLSCALVAGYYELCPFMFSWLIIGEASTPLLNLRWFLIRSGRGSRPYFKFVEMGFAVVFVISRFFVYATGLAYQLTIVGKVPDTVPRWAVAATMGFVVAGFVLNLTWLGKIYKLAAGTGRRREHAPDDGATAGATPEPVKTD